MQIATLLILGCIIGMQHALEADHLAAVASLSRRGSSRRALVLRGSAWGLGHTMTLLCICSVLWLLGETIGPRTEAMLEFAVGAMIVMLAINVLYTLRRHRPHIHVHRHSDGRQHLHLHRHPGPDLPHVRGHRDQDHDHNHEDLKLGRAALVGIVHGAAGSAGLLILATAARSATEAIGYVIAFGAGSMLGMAALSFIASYPLRWAERCANWVSSAAYATIAGAGILIGGSLMGRSWSLL